MRSIEKINFKIYIPLSIILLLAGYVLALNMAEFKVIITVFIAACINQAMLVRGVDKIVTQTATDEAVDNSMLIGLFIGKAIVLIVALIIGVQIMEKRIIIPVLIYVLQIGVLYLSFKKTGADQGSK